MRIVYALVLFCSVKIRRPKQWFFMKLILYLIEDIDSLSTNFSKKIKLKFIDAW